MEIDADDVDVLYRQVGFTAVAEGLDLVASTYRLRPIPAEVQFLLEEIVASIDADDPR